MNEEMTLFEEDAKTAPYVLGKVSAVFFAASDSFYKVVALRVLENNFGWKEKEIVATGSFGELQEDGTYRFFGKLVNHAKYGQQLQVTNYKSEGTNTEHGLITYLSGEMFTGIGEKTAERIVDLLGMDAINTIIADPASLDALGLKNDVVANLVETLRLNNGMEQVVIGLNEYGFGSTLATAIYQKYKTEALEIIRTNPYQLAEDIEGISFKRADQLAAVVGIEPDAPVRVQAGLLATLDQQSFNSGDVYMQVPQLLEQGRHLLETARNVAIDRDTLQQALLDLAQANKVVAEDTRIYLASLYEAEWRSAEWLDRLDAQVDQKQYADERIEKVLKKVEKRLKIKYDDRQKAAIVEAIKSPVFLLTGGPGTGKTTIINGLVATFAELREIDLDVNAYKDDTFPILLAAPTGRAAKRMSETTGLPASTIHRLLGMTGREKNTVPDIEDLKGALLIVDEMSMVDIVLFRTLLQAIPLKMHVVFVGDKDQLPSVGPGQVFSDLLASHHFQQVELTQIYRQENASSIIPLAHDIKDGRLPADLTVNQPDRTFIAAHAPQVPKVIAQVVKRAQDAGFAYNDVQVLAPMYRGTAGINNLNAVAQEALNPLKTEKSREVEFNGQKFRVGDKVLQLVNSPESNIFNGDIGKIVGIMLAKDKGNVEKVDQLTIAFDAGEVTYPRAEWNRLTLAYATSIHKAQGSEFKLVIMPLVGAFSIMLQRNLLYTGITRASEMLIMIGEPDAFVRSVNNLGANRLTTLQARINTISDGGKTPDLKSVAPEPSVTVTADDVPVASSVSDAPAGAPASKRVTPDVVDNGSLADNMSFDLFETPGAKTAVVEEETGEKPSAVVAKAVVKATVATEPVVAQAAMGTMLTLSMVTDGLVDPMVGMADVSPYDFMPEK